MNESCRYCPYIEAWIEEGDCIDLRMIGGGYISPAVLPDMPVDREVLNRTCETCRHAC